jgi:hypothetical protein
MAAPTLIVINNRDEEIVHKDDSVVIKTFPGGGAGVLETGTGEAIYRVEANGDVFTGVLSDGEGFCVPLRGNGSIAIIND